MQNEVWPEPWRPPSDRDQQGLENQLKRELGDGHVLKGKNVRLLARRFDRDDALFALDDGQVAQVHLTWKPAPGANALWPETTVFQSVEQWRSRPE
jgi:hypothetical protein